MEASDKACVGAAHAANVWGQQGFPSAPPCGINEEAGATTDLVPPLLQPPVLEDDESKEPYLSEAKDDEEDEISDEPPRNERASLEDWDYKMFDMKEDG